MNLNRNQIERFSKRPQHYTDVEYVDFIWLNRWQNYYRVIHYDVWLIEGAKWFLNTNGKKLKAIYF